MTVGIRHNKYTDGGDRFPTRPFRPPMGQVPRPGLQQRLEVALAAMEMTTDQETEHARSGTSTNDRGPAPGAEFCGGY